MEGLDHTVDSVGRCNLTRRGRLIDGIVMLYAAHLKEALAVQLEIMRDTSGSAATRLKAATAILEGVHTWVATQEQEKTIAAINAKLAEYAEVLGEFGDE